MRAPGSPSGPSRSRPHAAVDVADHLRKSGGTQFFIGDLALHYPGGLFAPPSYLNALRRGLFEAAEEALRAAARPSPDALDAARRRYEGALPEIAAEGARPSPVTPTLSVYTDTGRRGAAPDAACPDRIYWRWSYARKRTSPNTVIA